MKQFLSTHRALLLRIAVLLACIVIIGLIWHGSTRPPKIIQLDPITKVIEVPVDKITEKTVTKYVQVQDRAAVNKLLAENKQLKANVQQLTVALATNTSTGSGTIMYLPPANGLPAPDPQPFKFKDWRLDFTSPDGQTGAYTLTQKFVVVNTVGRNDKNVPVNIIGLFEIDDKGERKQITVDEITTIVTQQDRAKFYLKPTLQAGVAVMPDTTQNIPAFSVAIPWLKRGTARVVENTRYAYVSPVVVVNGKNTVVGIMPISVNLGTLKYTPFSDIWVSPFGGVTSTSTKRFGVVFSATF